MISIRSLRLLLLNAIVVLICSPVVVSAAAPTGNLDGVQADGIALGWALDTDTSSQSIHVHFYIDGPAGQGTLVGASTANVPRADVNTTIGVTGDHGFSFQIPATYVGGSHQLYAYAIDSSGTGDNPNLSGSPKTFTISAPNNPVVGNFEQAKNDGTVSGWVFDPDAPSQSIDVHVYIDAPAGQGTLVAAGNAALARPDVNAAHGITGAHGFKISIPHHFINDKSHSIYVYGIDTKAGASNPLMQGSPRAMTLSIPTQSSLGNASISAHGITIKTTSRLAGAIDSLQWGGKEFVDSADHGRQIQTAWTGNDYGECFNPTEAGSAADGSGQYSTSQLLSLTTTANSLTSTSHSAFWQTPGTYGENCNFNTNPADLWLGGPTVNVTDQTRSTLNKSVTIGVPGLPNVIEYISRITLDAQELAQVPLKHIILENPAVYMPTEFKRVYRVDTSGALAELGPNQPNFNKFLFDPVILATEDGKYALGLYSDEIPRSGYSHSVQKGYVGYGIYNWVVAMGMDTRAPKLPTSGNYFTAGTYTYKSYLAVGTLEDVRAAIQKLSTQNSSPVEGGSVTIPPTISPIANAPSTSVTPSRATSVTTTPIEALQAQIQILLAQIKSLQTQKGINTSLWGASIAASVSCPNLTRNLSRGMRGTDVTQLQQFLISQKLLAPDSATGFFGAMTEAAVKKLQCQKMNICSGSPSTNGYGVIGARTRAVLAARCRVPQPRVIEEVPPSVVENTSATSWSTIDVSKFIISLPPGWVYNPKQGIDSFVGEFAGDGIKLTFDYGAYGGQPSVQVRVATQSYTVSQEVIGGYSAEIMTPKVAGVGDVGAYVIISDGCTSAGICGNKLGLKVSGSDILLNLQETVLKIVRSIQIKNPSVSAPTRGNVAADSIISAAEGNLVSYCAATNKIKDVFLTCSLTTYPYQVENGKCQERAKKLLDIRNLAPTNASSALAQLDSLVATREMPTALDVQTVGQKRDTYVTMSCAALQPYSSSNY